VSRSVVHGRLPRVLGRHATSGRVRTGHGRPPFVERAQIRVGPASHPRSRGRACRSTRDGPATIERASIPSPWSRRCCRSRPRPFLRPAGRAGRRPAATAVDTNRGRTRRVARPPMRTRGNGGDRRRGRECSRPRTPEPSLARARHVAAIWVGTQRGTATITAAAAGACGSERGARRSVVGTVVGAGAAGRPSLDGARPTAAQARRERDHEGDAEEQARIANPRTRRASKRPPSPGRSGGRGTDRAGPSDRSGSSSRSRSCARA